MEPDILNFPEKPVKLLGNIEGAAKNQRALLPSHCLDPQIKPKTHPHLPGFPETLSMEMQPKAHFQ